MRRGPKPTPTLLFDLHGRPSKGRKKNPAEPKPAGDLFTAPDWLSETQTASWIYALQHAPPGLLTRLDRGALVVWAVAEDLHRQAVIAQAKLGGLVSKLKGTQVFVQSPFLPIINRQALIMLRSASELGFTPAARSNLSAGGGDHPPGDGPDALDDFLASDPDRKPTIN